MRDERIPSGWQNVTNMVDATQEDWDLLGLGTSSLYGVLSDLDEVDEHARGVPESVGWWDPLSLRFHDLQQEGPGGVPDRRMTHTSVNDYEGPYESVRDGDVSFGQVEVFSSANRSTRERDLLGRVAIPSSFRKVVDSEDGRYALAQTFIPLDLGSSAGPLSAADGGDGAALTDGLKFFGPGSTTGSDGQSGSVTRTSPGVSFNGVTFFSGAAVTAAQNALAAGYSAADAARAASAAARGLPPPPPVDPVTPPSTQTRTNAPEPDRNPGGSVVQQDRPGGYAWDGELIGLTGTLWTAQGAAAPGKYFDGSEGTPITRLGVRHDAHVVMDGLTGRVYYSSEDCASVPRGSKPFKGEMRPDSSRANVDTEVGLENCQWRPVVHVDAALPPTRTPPPEGTPWNDAGKADPKDGEEDEPKPLPQPLPLPIGPLPPAPGGGGPKPPRPGNDPDDPKNQCKRPKGAGSGQKPDEPVGTRPRGPEQIDGTTTGIGLGLDDPGAMGLETGAHSGGGTGGGTTVGETGTPQPIGPSTVGAPLPPVSMPNSQVRDYSGMGVPCVNATSGRRVEHLPHGPQLGGLVKRTDGAVIDTHGHTAVTRVGSSVAVGGEEASDDTGSGGGDGGAGGGGRVRGFTRQRSGGGPDDRVFRIGLPITANPTAGFVVEEFRRRSQEERDEATRTRVKRLREQAQQALDESKAAASEGRKTTAKTKGFKAARLKRMADRAEERLKARIDKRKAREDYYARKRAETAAKLDAYQERTDRANADRASKGPFRPAPQTGLPQGAFLVDVTEPSDAFGSGNVLPAGVDDASPFPGTTTVGGSLGSSAALGLGAGAPAAGFGGWNVLNAPLPHMGAVGGAKTVEDQVHLLTSTVEGLKAVANGAFGGPSYLNANLGLQETTRPGRPPAGSRIGQKVFGVEGAVSRVQKAVLEVVSVLDNRDGSGINATGDGVFSVRRMHVGTGITDRRPLVYLDNNVCTSGDPDGDLIATPDYGFVVGPTGCVRAPCVTIQQTGKPGTQCATTMTATNSGLAVQPHGLTDGRPSTARWSFAKDGGLYFDGGSFAVFHDSNESTTTTVGQATDGTLAFVGDVGITGNLTVLGFLDPTGVGFIEQASKPSELDASTPGLWVSSTGPTLYWWDGSTSTDIGGGSGGGDHDVADAATNTSVKAISLNHTTSGTAAAGFGVHQDWELEDAAGNVDVATRLATVWTTATDGSEDADFVAETMLDGSLFEWLRWDASLGALLLDATDDVTAGTINTRVGYWRGVGNGVDAPVDGFGAQWGMALQRLSGTVTNVADVEWWWSDVSASEAAVGFVVLGTGDMLQLLGGSGAVLLPNGILEFADQGTLGTPATGYGRAGYDVTADPLRPRWVDQAGTETSLALLSDVGGGGGDHDVADAATNTISTAVDISHTTSGTAATGFGVRQTWSLEDSAGNTDVAAAFDVEWVDATSGSEDSRFTLSTMVNGTLAETLEIQRGFVRPATGTQVELGGDSNLWSTIYGEQLYQIREAGGNTVTTTFIGYAKNSGSGGVGLGSRWEWRMEDAAGVEDEAGQLDVLWTAVGTGAEDSDMIVRIMADGSLVEALRLDADGDGAGGTDTAVLVTQGRLDLAEQATPGTPPTGRHRFYVDDETAWARDEVGERRALDNLKGADAAAADTQSSGGSSAETLKSIPLEAGYLETDGEGLRITAWGTMAAGGSAAVKWGLISVGGVQVAGVSSDSTTALRQWKLVADVFRTGATTYVCMYEGKVTDSTGALVTNIMDRLTTGTTTWANALDVTAEAIDAGSGDRVSCDVFYVEPLIRA